MLTLAMLRTLWPRGDSAVPGLIEAIAADAPTLFPKYGLDSDLAIAHAMAQFSVECAGGSLMQENINYTPARACVVWPNRFENVADCYAKIGAFDGDPDFCAKLINFVYGGRNGNRIGTDDGVTFIGRGLSQVTGRANYADVGTSVGLDLLGNPDLLSAPEHALECGLASFVLCNCLPFALADDVQGVTKHLNGDFTGLKARTDWLLRWKTALGSQDPPLHSTAWLQNALNRLGADPALIPNGMYGPQTEAAVRGFQTARALEIDGKVGPETWAALDAALAALN